MNKLLVERAARAAPDLPATVLRLPAVVGPGDERWRRVGRYLAYIDSCRSDVALDAALSMWRWTRGYVEDVGEAVAMATVDAAASGHTYNVGEADPQTEGDWGPGHRTHRTTRGTSRRDETRRSARGDKARPRRPERQPCTWEIRQGLALDLPERGAFAGALRRECRPRSQLQAAVRPSTKSRWAATLRRTVRARRVGLLSIRSKGEPLCPVVRA